MKKTHRTIVSALIFSKDNKILMGKKDPDDGVYADCWHLPGGGVEENEDLSEALKREVKEEVDIDITNYKPELVNTDKGESEKVLKETGEKVIVEMDFFVYKIVLSDKNHHDLTVQLGDDLVEYKWFDIKDLQNTKLTSPSVNLFKKLGFVS